jgi:hypothetical protein
MSHGAIAVIPSKTDRKMPIPHDIEMYKWRHLIENCFQRLKEFRRVATRYEKTDTSFAAVILAAWRDPRTIQASKQRSKKMCDQGGKERDPAERYA